MDSPATETGVHRRKNKGKNGGGSRRGSTDEGTSAAPPTATNSTADPKEEHRNLAHEDVPKVLPTEDIVTKGETTALKKADQKEPSSSASLDLLDRLDQRSAWILPLVIFALALFTRFYRLDQPPGVVFDESHFGRFTNQYTKGEYFFDIHPPLGKLTFWAVGKLVGYDANACNYTKIDTPYAEDCKYIWLRATAAFFGSATAPIFYQLARGFGASPRGSLLTSMLFIFDGLNSSEARWVLIDSQLMFWIAFCALVGQFWFARWNRACDALDLHEARLIVASDVFERSKRLLKDSQGGSSDAEIETATIRAVLSPSLDAEAEATLIIGASANAVGGGDATAKRAVAVGNGTPMAPGNSHDGVEEPTFQRLFTYDSINPAAPTTAANSKAVALVNAQKSLPQRVQDAVFYKLQQDSRYLNLAQRAFWILAVGIACGNAVSVKFTGLATPAILGLESLFALFLIKRSYPFPDLFCILLTGTLVFYCYWFAHFSLLWNTGDGDVFMMTEFQRTLKGNPHYDPTAQRANYWWLTTWLVQDMIKANAGILEPHAWQSTWDEWILNLRGVLYYSVDSKHTYTKAIYLNGNPIVVWFLLGCVVIAALLMVLWQRYRYNPDHDLTKFKPFFSVMSWCLVLYALNLLPYLGVKRSCFAYHYMPAMMWAQILAGVLVDQLAGKRWMPWAFKIITAAVVGTYLFFAPWIYGFPLTNDGHDRRRWLPRWN